MFTLCGAVRSPQSAVRRLAPFAIAIALSLSTSSTSFAADPALATPTCSSQIVGNMYSVKGSFSVTNIQAGVNQVTVYVDYEKRVNGGAWEVTVHGPSD